MINTINTVLVANRGEIACRVIRTLRDQGVRSVAVYSDADADAPHVRAADVAVHIGPSPARESYLVADRILDAARRTGAQAIHPGYGFLSENAAFARACEDAGIIFMGPPASAIDTMGDKISARATVEKRDVPTVPGISRPGLTDDELSTFQEQLSSILGHIEVLNQLDTDDISPTAQVIQVENAMRDDTVQPSLGEEVVTRLAPRHEKGFIAVPAVLGGAEEETA